MENEKWLYIYLDNIRDLLNEKDKKKIIDHPNILLMICNMNEENELVNENGEFVNYKYLFDDKLIKRKRVKRKIAYYINPYYFSWNKLENESEYIKVNARMLKEINLDYQEDKMDEFIQLLSHVHFSNSALCFNPKEENNHQIKYLTKEFLYRYNDYFMELKIMYDETDSREKQGYYTWQELLEDFVSSPSQIERYVKRNVLSEIEHENNIIYIFSDKFLKHEEEKEFFNRKTNSLKNIKRNDEMWVKINDVLSKTLTFQKKLNDFRKRTSEVKKEIANAFAKEKLFLEEEKNIKYELESILYKNMDIFENPREVIELSEEYFTIYMHSEEVEYIMEEDTVKCVTCNEYKEKQSYSFFKEVCDDCFNKRYRIKKELELEEERKAKRARLTALLPKTLNSEEERELREQFNDCCSISKRKSYVALDHFIPINWGHGGTTKENMIPLNRSLNSSKSDSNPFEWIEKKENKKWKKQFGLVVEHLAKLNNLTEEEYEKYVNWCHVNQRTEAQIIMSKGKTSLELWKEAVSNQISFKQKQKPDMEDASNALDTMYYD